MTRILVVEDEDHLATIIKFNLQEEGYAVTAVADGPTALAEFERHREEIGLIILDLMLPGMSGYSVCENLRAAGHTVPILVLSARTLTEDRARAFNCGADQYMMKPFDLDEFLSRAKNLLARHNPRAAAEDASEKAVRKFEFGQACVNFDTFEVSVGGKPVRMTTLELKLLQYFVENEGRVIPRRELLENVWNMPGNISTRAPDQFIRRQRKTFEPDPGKPRHFVTIRDAGYRFLASGLKADP
jgi:two-component system OmpR family response regulator